MTEYLEELEKLTLNLMSLKKIALENEFNSIGNKCNEVLERIDKNQFVITVIGEFNRGKSTFINALLGVDIIPTSIRPTTATINIIHYDEIPSVRVHKNDGEILKLDFSTSALTDYTSLVDFSAKTVKYIEITYPLDYLKDGTTIVDTPGVNDMDEQRLDVTYGYMPNSDAVIFLFDVDTPFKQTEKNFLTEKVLLNNIPQLFFIANKSDKVDQEELKQSVDEIKKQLSTMLAMPDIIVYPLSAKKALDSRMGKEGVKILPKLFEQFEKELKRFILGGDRFKTKLLNYENQYQAIISNFIEDIKIEMRNSKLSDDELLAAKEKIKLSEDKYKDAFEKLLKYVDEQNITFSRRIESSLLKDYRSKEELFLHNIDLQKGNISEYSSKVLNYEIGKSLKNWIEQSQPFIDQNVKAIISKTLDGYEKYFSKTPVINSIYKNQALSIANSIEKIELTENITGEAIVKRSRVLGALLVGGLGIMTYGIALPVLGFTMGGAAAGQQLLGNRFLKKQQEEQKKELLSKFPNVLSKSYEVLRTETLNTINLTLDNFKKVLSDDFDKTFLELKESIDKSLKSKDYEKTKNSEKIVELEKLIKTIKTKEK